MPLNANGGMNGTGITMGGRKDYMSGLVETDAVQGGGFTMMGQDSYLYNQYGYSGGQQHMGFSEGGMMGGQAMQDMHFSNYEFGAFDGMALPDHFLGQYYSEVSILTVKCVS